MLVSRVSFQEAAAAVRLPVRKMMKVFSRDARSTVFSRHRFCEETKYSGKILSGLVQMVS